MGTYNYMVWVLNALEIIACITGFLYLKKLQKADWKLLPYYLLTIVTFEFLGRYLSSVGELYKYNPIMFNYISYPMQFLFFFYLFYRHQYFARKKQLIVAGIIIYLISIVADVFVFSKRIYFFHSFSYCTGVLLLLILLLIYFLDFIKGKEILNFSTDLMFWFCVGLLVYYIGTLPFFALRNNLAYNHKDIFFKYAYAGLVLDYCMYLLFIIGIKRCRVK